MNTPEKLKKWWKNNRFLYPHTWKHLKQYHEWLRDKIKKLADKSKTLKEFEEWLDDLAKQIVEDPVWKWLISRDTIESNLSSLKK